MDKYTIDLDKLLNDFEYSELTEQNNILSSNCQNSQIPYQKNHATQKHSINNVFHSLNEYLNTDIRSDLNTPGTSLDNNEEMPVLVKKDVPSIEQIFNNISKDESNENHINNNSGPKILNINDDCIEVMIVEQPEIKSEKSVANVRNILVPKVKNIDQIQNNVNENVKESNVKDDVKIVQNVEEIVPIVQDAPNEQDVPEQNMNNVKVQDLVQDFVPIVQDFVPLVEEDVPLWQQVVVQVISNELNAIVENMGQEVVPKVQNVDKPSIKQENVENIEQNVVPIVQDVVPKVQNVVPIVQDIVPKVQNVNIPPKQENVENIGQNVVPIVQDVVPIVQEVVPKVQNIDIPSIKNVNEGDIVQDVVPIVQDVVPIVQDIVPKVQEVVPKVQNIDPPSIKNVNVGDNGQNVVPIVQDVVPQVQQFVPKVQNVDVPSIKNVNVENVGQNVVPNESEEKDVVPNLVNHEDNQENVVVEDVVPQPKPIKFDSSIDLSDTEVENELEQLEQEYQNKLITERPNSLELPPINLIGEPGSTPYNNVYVTKTELSPTLSESSSTYDQSDSPNTSDSCNSTSIEEPPAGGNQATTTSPSPITNPANLGKSAPFWTPDSDALNCLHCSRKFTVINRRHHCRACGLVLCSKCASMKTKLEYMNQEARVCLKCYHILNGESEVKLESDLAPNPNNPMEYCSKIPPLMQTGGTAGTGPPPSVMVPVVGVLKRKGAKPRVNKSVMFMDGIRPGCDLTELDSDFNYKTPQITSKSNKIRRDLPQIDPKTNSYIPGEGEALPPCVSSQKAELFYTDYSNDSSLIQRLKTSPMTFALQRNFHVTVKILNLDCCVNKWVWGFSTDGMISVGQDELVILLEFIDNELLPKDVFLHLIYVFLEAEKGTSIVEMGLSLHPTSMFLGSKNHAGFLYIKPTFQCVQNLVLPKEPFLIGLLIHRWETPWAKIFPLRLLLRLGAEYRYYPSPIVSTRFRESVYVEIGHTIINLLADFRNFSYTIPSVRGLTIHMEDKNTTVSIPMNRYDQVMKALNNSSEHILAFSANFSATADSHLVCIQDTHGNNENAYTTHAINIHNKPRKVTGASFIILNGALKSTSGLTAKSSIIEDGLMIHILPEQMQKLRQSLKNMKNFKINCGCVNAASDESISINWTENDVHFNIGVLSPIDSTPLNGIPSIRVHNGRDFVCNSGNKMIRWTEVFIIQNGEELMKTQDLDISKISESISKATSQALVKYLDLLATNSCTKIGIRTNLNIENVSYLAGSNGAKLPPIYMKSLDNELIPVLHKITSNFAEQVTVVLELKFHILNV